MMAMVLEVMIVVRVLIVTMVIVKTIAVILIVKRDELTTSPLLLITKEPITVVIVVTQRLVTIAATILPLKVSVTSQAQ